MKKGEEGGLRKQGDCSMNGFTHTRSGSRARCRRGGERERERKGGGNIDQWKIWGRDTDGRCWMAVWI